MYGAPICALAAAVIASAARMLYIFFIVVIILFRRCCYLIILYRVSFLVEETNAEVAHAWAVDDGTTQDVTAFLQGETWRHGVVLHHTAVAREQQGFLPRRNR